LAKFVIAKTTVYSLAFKRRQPPRFNRLAGDWSVADGVPQPVTNECRLFCFSPCKRV